MYLGIILHNKNADIIFPNVYIKIYLYTSFFVFTNKNIAITVNNFTIVFLKVNILNSSNPDINQLISNIYPKSDIINNDDAILFEENNSI